jgi:hypothetical protein
MAIRFLWLMFLATSIPLANAQTAAAPAAAAAAKRPIRISVKNEYVVDLDFGPLGNGRRSGTDSAEGELKWQGGKYVGSVTAKVSSLQSIAGLVGDCGPGHYNKSQKLDVVGKRVDGFNSESQSVDYDRAASTGRESSEFLLLSFVPHTDPLNPMPLPDRDDNGQLLVACHTLIERPQGDPYMPFNDSRWTTDQSGYVIVLPATGVLHYTDSTVPEGSSWGSAYAPMFKVHKSIWTVEIDRLP